MMQLTSIAIALLVAGIGSAQPVPSTFISRGTGCAGRNGVPTLTNTGFMSLGKSMSVDLSNAVDGTAVLFIGATPVDASLAVLGASGCSILGGLDASISVSVTGGKASVPLAVPVDYALLDVSAYMQFGNVDPAANALGVTMSNGGLAVVGDSLPQLAIASVSQADSSNLINVRIDNPGTDADDLCAIVLGSSGELTMLRGERIVFDTMGNATAEFRQIGTTVGGVPFGTVCVRRGIGSQVGAGPQTVVSLMLPALGDAWVWSGDDDPASATCAGVPFSIPEGRPGCSAAWSLYGSVGSGSVSNPHGFSPSHVAISFPAFDTGSVPAGMIPMITASLSWTVDRGGSRRHYCIAIEDHPVQGVGSGWDMMRALIAQLQQLLDTEFPGEFIVPPDDPLYLRRTIEVNPTDPAYRVVGAAGFVHVCLPTTS